MSLLPIQYQYAIPTLAFGDDGEPFDKFASLASILLYVFRIGIFLVMTLIFDILISSFYYAVNLSVMDVLALMDGGRFQAPPAVGQPLQPALRGRRTEKPLIPTAAPSGGRSWALPSR